jgi:hypothetical protein
VKESEILKKVGKRISLKDLPEELLESLTLKIETVKSNIIKIIDDFEGIANINEILISYYKRYGRIYKRTYMINILHRLCTEGKIIRYKPKKGIYILNENKTPKEKDNVNLS